MGRKDEDDGNLGQWKYVKEWLTSPKGIGMVVGFSILALMLENPWVFFGLTMGIIGAATSYARKRSAQEQEFMLYKHQTTTSVPPTQPEVQPPEIHKKVIEDAKPDFNEIRAASAVAMGAVGENLRSIVKNAEIMQHELLRDSSKLSEVQRVFTYYIPATADLLTARGKAIANNDEAKALDIDNMIARLEAAFRDFAARLHGEDVRSIDIDIKLLDQSLKQDLPFEIRDKQKS
jgi:hypothetical protein